MTALAGSEQGWLSEPPAWLYSLLQSSFKQITHFDYPDFCHNARGAPAEQDFLESFLNLITEFQQIV